MKIGCIINPRSGKYRRRGEKKRQELKQALNRSAPDALIHIVDRRRPQDTDRALAAMIDRPIDALIVSGGDGTLQRIAGALIRRQDDPARRPAIALFPHGATNAVAHGFGVKMRPQSLIESLVETPKGQWRGENRRLATLAVGDRDGDGDGEPTPIASGFIFGAGLLRQGVAMSRKILPRFGDAGHVALACRLAPHLLNAALGKTIAPPQGIERILLERRPDLPDLECKGDLTAVLAATLPQLPPFWTTPLDAQTPPDPSETDPIQSEIAVLVVKRKLSNAGALLKLLCARPDHRGDKGYVLTRATRLTLCGAESAVLDGRFIAGRRNAPKPNVYEVASGPNLAFIR